MNHRYDSRSVLTDQQRESARERADLSRLVAALTEIEAFHTENRTGLKLQPPLGEAELEKTLSEFPCIVPDELRALWTWRNGEETDKFIWYHRFLPVQVAIEEYKQLTSSPLLGWSENWIPVFEFEGEWYAVECAPEKIPGAPVIHYFVEDDPTPAYLNLTLYMEMMAAAIRQGALRWEGQWWEDDTPALSQIHQRLNPTIGFPYHVAE